MVIDGDAPGSGEMIELCNAHMRNIMTVGESGRYLNLRDIELDGFTQRLLVMHHRGSAEVKLPLVGDFQASNALVAAALVATGGVPINDILPQLERLKGAKGRLELAGRKMDKKDGHGAPVFIDYAHTPDALERALGALTPYKQGKLVVVFGCGGDRDKGKRSVMGQIASASSDVVIVTDDNPRGEVAGDIRAEIMKTSPQAIEIGDRAEAIAHGISLLREGDLLLVAGKGHETGQIIGSEVFPFSDHDVVSSCLVSLNHDGEVDNG